MSNTAKDETWEKTGGILKCLECPQGASNGWLADDIGGIYAVHNMIPSKP